MKARKIFQNISWQDFETLCYKYVETKYKTTLKSLDKELVHIESNIGAGNTGCDAAIYYAHPQFDQTIWFEFKRYSRSIGLDVIGKYAVILVSRAIGKFVLLSASNITNSALAEFSDFMYKSNIEAEYIFGDHLLEELKRYVSPTILNRFNIESELSKENTPLISLSFLDGNPTSNYYSSWEQSQGEIEIRRDDVFYLMFSIYNPTVNSIYIKEESIKSISTQLQKNAPYLKVNYIGSPLLVEHVVNTHQCITIKFACYSIKQVPKILFPSVQVFIESKESYEEYKLTLPNVKFTRPKQNSLLGRSNINFLSSVFSQLQTLHIPKPFIVLIEGLSGTGKSRLLDEILCKAKIQGINVYHQNGEIDISPKIIKRFLSDCLNLQYSRFNGQYTKDYLVNLCAKNSIPTYHAVNIHDFLINNKESEEIFYSITEIMGFALSRAPIEPRLIAIDNLQEYNQSFINIFDKLIDLTFSNDIALSIILVSNTEKIAYQHKQFSNFIKRITNLSTNAPGFFVKHTCNDLSAIDAHDFLKNRLNNFSSEFLNGLINKIGRRPLDLEICASYFDELNMQSEENIEVNGSTLLFSSKKQIPEKIRSIYQSRLNNIISNDINNEEVLRIISWILLMNYGLPYEFIPISESTKNAINTLVNKRIIKLTTDENKICFFHQNMAEFLATYAPALTMAMETSEQLFTLLNKGKNFLSELEYEIAKFNIQYYIEPSSDVLARQAKKVISHLNTSGYHAQAIDICKKALRLVKDTTVDNAESIVFLKTTEAFLEMEFFNLKKGTDMLLDCKKEVLRWKGCLPKSLVLSYFVDLLNGLLHTCKNKRAILAINNVRHYIDEDDYNLQFHIANRKCVAHMHLNEIDLAIDEGYKTIKIAKQLTDPFYLSKAYSDMGYALLHSINESPQNLSESIKNYGKAIELHNSVQTAPPSRDIEIENHKGIKALLEGDYKKASTICKTGLQICLERHYMYLYPRICILGSVAEINMGNLDVALEFLYDALAVSKEYDYPRVWKIQNNIAIIDALNGRIKEAQEKIFSIINFLNKNVANDFVFLKEQVVIRNAIYLASLTSQDLKEVLSQVEGKDDYLGYVNQCMLSNNQKSRIEIIEPGNIWHFNKLSGLEGIFL